MSSKFNSIGPIELWNKLDPNQRVHVMGVMTEMLVNGLEKKIEFLQETNDRLQDRIDKLERD